MVSGEGAGKLEVAVQCLSSVHPVLCRDLQGPEMDTNLHQIYGFLCPLNKTSELQDIRVILKCKKLVLSTELNTVKRLRC